MSISISAGWKTQNGKTFYYSPVDGHLYHSWSQIDNKNYYFDPDDGHMLIGDSTSRKFHKASCSSVRDMRDYNKVGFDSRSEAIDAGYTPCKRCHP